MIEFNGYITGDAERFFWNNSRKWVRNLLFTTFLILLPVILFIAVKEKYWELLIAYTVICLTTPLLLLIPKSKNEKADFTPKRIFTDEEYIVCQGNKYEEFHLIDDASKLVDYGKFYYIIFPFGKKSDKFICQKNLLTKGTLQEFESLFEGKIERRINTTSYNKH